MISHFTVLGDFYQHRQYSSLMTDWYTYPWLAGGDNRLTLNTEGQVYSVKTRWDDIAGSKWKDDVLTARLAISSADVLLRIIRMDQWGNFGTDTGQDPPNIPGGWRVGVTNLSVNDATSEQKFFPNFFDSNNTLQDAGVSTGGIISVFAAESARQFFEVPIELGFQPDDFGVAIGGVISVYEAQSKQTFFPNFFDSNSERPDEGAVKVSSVLVFEADSVNRGS